MFKKFYLVAEIIFLFLVMCGGVLFFGPGKAKADSQSVVINEVYYNTSTGNQWIELYNGGCLTINLSGFDLDVAGTYYHFNSFLLAAHTFTIVHVNAIGTNNAMDLYQGNSANMSKTSGTAALFNSTTHSSKTIIDFVEYGASSQTWQSAAISAGLWDAGDFVPNVATGHSIERNSLGQNTHKSSDFIDQTNPTPGTEVAPPVPPPMKPDLVLPINQKIIDDSSEIDFSWNGDGNSNYEFILSSNSDPQKDSFFDIPDLSVTNYKISGGLDFGTYYWQVIASNDFGETSSVIYSFTFQKPVYSSDIIVNELMPNPSNDEATNEWIELYNNSANTIDLSGWSIEDLKGAVTIYKLPAGTEIGPYGFLIIYRQDSGIILNNDTDGIALYQPDGALLMQTPIFNTAAADVAWARAPDGTWDWTITPTSGSENLITPIPMPAKSGGTVKKTTATKKTTVKKAAASVVKAVSAATNLDTSQAKAASDAGSVNNKSSLFSQILELVTSLSVIFLVLLLVKIKRHPKQKIIGGNFGKDET